MNLQKLKTNKKNKNNLENTLKKTNKKGKREYEIRKIKISLNWGKVA